MTLLEEVLLYDEYEDLGGFSATTFNKPTYQYYMQKTYGRVDPSPEDKVAIQLGNGFHYLSEKVLSTQHGYTIEETLVQNLKKYLITGTPDVINHGIAFNPAIEDWKVKGPYLFQKTFRGDIDDLIIQESIYRWLYEKSYPESNKISDIGKGHIICAGWQQNTMRIQKKFKDQYPDLEFYPKYMTVDVPLMSIEDTEAFMFKWIEKYEMQSVHQVMDCHDDGWTGRCDYCDAKCIHNPKYKGE